MIDSARLILRQAALQVRLEVADRFEANGDRLKAIAGEKRWRIWRMYLAGCAHGFANNWISIYQVLAVKARATRELPLPLTREYMYDGTH